MHKSNQVLLFTPFKAWVPLIYINYLFNKYKSHQQLLFAPLNILDLLNQYHLHH
jgi:hypothetical protein